MPEIAWTTPIDEITSAYRRKIRWQNALNGVAEKPKQTRQDVVAQMKGFAAWHNAARKQKERGGMVAAKKRPA